jgi:hypothetical protein
MSRYCGPSIGGPSWPVTFAASHRNSPGVPISRRLSRHELAGALRRSTAPGASAPAAMAADRAHELTGASRQSTAPVAAPPAGPGATTASRDSASSEASHRNSLGVPMSRRLCHSLPRALLLRMPHAHHRHRSAWAAHRDPSFEQPKRVGFILLRPSAIHVKNLSIIADKFAYNQVLGPFLARGMRGG